MGGLRMALGLVSLGTALIAAWLAIVLVTVLPDRSPASIPTWIAVCAVAVTAVAVGAAWLARPRSALAWALRVVGIATAVVGGCLAAAWLLTPPGREGEGYVLLIGGWLVVHGLVALLAAGVPRPVAAHGPGPSRPVT